MKLRPRQEMKKAWMMMKFMIEYGTHLTSEQREDLINAEQKMLTQINSMRPMEIDSDDIVLRRKNLGSSPELKEILSMFWAVLSIEIDEEGVLSKEAYVEFNTRLQVALMGDAVPDEGVSIECAESDYLHDVHAYGEINEITFRDVMMELIEVWSDMVNTRYYTAFAWALLGSMIDIQSFPPKFRAKKKISCITSIENETDILTKFHSEKKLRSNIQLKGEWLNAANLRPEVQKRLSSRRAGTIHHSSSEVLDILRISEAHRLRSSTGAESPVRLKSFESGDGDSDDETGKKSIKSTGSGASPNGKVRKRRSSSATWGFSDDDDDVSNAPSVRSGFSKRSIKSPSAELAPSRSNSILSAAAPEGALPTITSTSGSDKVSPPPTSRPGSRRDRSTAIAEKLSSKSSPKRIIVGSGVHRQYSRGASMIAPRKEGQVTDDQAVDFAQELREWLKSVTNFSGLACDTSSPVPCDRPTLKRSATMGSCRYSPTSRGGTPNGRLFSPTRSTESLDSVEGAAQDKTGDGDQMCDGMSQPCDTKPLHSSKCDDISDEEGSEISEASSTFMGIRTSGVSSRAPINPQVRGEEIGTTMMRSAKIMPQMHRGVSSLNFLMEEAGLLPSDADKSTSSHMGSLQPETTALSNVWHPRRTQVKLKKIVQPTPKMKIAKVVAEDRRKYRASGYLPEVKRGKNPLIQSGQSTTKESQVTVLREALAEHSHMLMAEAAAQHIDKESPSSRYVLDSYGGVRRRADCPKEVSAARTKACVPLKNATEKKYRNVCKEDRQFTSSGEESYFFLTGPNDVNVMSSGTDTYRVPSSLFMNTGTVESKPGNNKSSHIWDHAATCSGGTAEGSVTSHTVPQYHVMSYYRRGFASVGSLRISPMETPTLSQSQSITRSVLKAAGPWVPPGGLDVMVSDKTDTFFGHEENRDVGKVYENTKNKTIIGRQNIVRGAFEKYCKEAARTETFEIKSADRGQAGNPCKPIT